MDKCARRRAFKDTVVALPFDLNFFIYDTSFSSTPRTFGTIYRTYRWVGILMAFELMRVHYLPIHMARRADDRVIFTRRICIKWRNTYGTLGNMSVALEGS